MHTLNAVNAVVLSSNTGWSIMRMFNYPFSSLFSERGVVSVICK